MAVHFETSNLFHENNVLLLIMVSHRVLTYYHLLPGLEFLEPGRVLPVPDDQTFKEMIQAKEEWQPRPRYIASSQSAYNSQQSEGLKIKDRPKQTSPLVQEPPPPLMVQEDTAEQYQALSLARGQDSKTENHGFGRTYTYHSPWRTMKVSPKYQNYLSYSNSRRPARRKQRSILLVSPICPDGYVHNTTDTSICIGDK